MDNKNLISGLLVCFNTVYGLSTIENVFSIVLLSFQIIYLLILVGIKIYRALQDKKITKEEFEDIKGTMDELKDTLDKGGKSNDKKEK